LRERDVALAEQRYQDIKERMHHEDASTIHRRAD
jgi:hypothetical protein